MSTTHGPWTIEKIKHASGWTYRIGSDAMRAANAAIEIHDDCFTDKCLPPSECEAIVRLIASTPLLLEATKMARSHLALEGKIYGPSIKLLDEVIAKAGGTV